MKRIHKRALAVCAFCLAASMPVAAQQFINILTGGTSGIYYPIGVGLSQIYAKVIPDAKATVQSTKASVENLNLLQAGRGEIALSLADAVSGAWNGNEEMGFKAPLKKLRGVSGVYSNYIQIVASAESGIKTLADLKGKRISVGAPKSGTELNARAILNAAGLTYKDFAKVEYLPFGESVELIKNRQLDVTLQSAGLGVASIRDLAAAVKIVVVPIPADVVAKVGDAAYQAGDHSRRHLRGRYAGHADGGDPELPDHPRGRARGSRLQDDQRHVREPRHAGRRACCSEKHQARQCPQGHAGAAASWRGAVLQGKGPGQVAW